jgi:hypothetical protein
VPRSVPSSRQLSQDTQPFNSLHQNLYLILPSPPDMKYFITFALIPALIIALMPTISPIETLQWSGTRAWRGMVLGLRRSSIAGLKWAACFMLIAGAICWSLFFLALYPITIDGFRVWSRVGQVAGVIFGLITSVAALLIIRPKVWLNHRIYDWGAVRWADALISAVIWGIGSALVGGLYGELTLLSGGIDLERTRAKNWYRYEGKNFAKTSN